MSEAALQVPKREIAVLPGSQQYDDVLARAREAIPYLRSKSDDINAARRVPEEVMKRLKDAGLVSLLRPARFGGAGATMDLMYRVAQQLARGDASAAWVYVVLGTHDRVVGYFPKNVQEEFWKSKHPMCASSFNPTGKATLTPGGITLSGKWSFCSGIDFCDWIVVGGIVGMLAEDPSVPDFRFILVPTGQGTIIDDWHVMGLSGTGSKSIVFDKVFVPNERVVSGAEHAAGRTPGALLHDDPSYRVPGWALFIFSLPAVATAAVRNAYEDLKVECQEKLKKRDKSFELKKPAIQLMLSEASVLLDSSDLLYDRALNETFDLANRGEPVPIELRGRNRRDVGYGVVSARRAAELMMAASGGRATLETGLVQRALRDVYALAAHPSQSWEVAALSFGSVEVGGPATDPFM